MEQVLNDDLKTRIMAGLRRKTDLVSAAETQSRDSNVIDVISDLQNEINQLKSENKRLDLLNRFNDYRLQMFPTKDSIESELIRKFEFELSAIAGTENGLEDLQRWHKHHVTIAGIMMDTIEEWKKQAPIKIKTKEKADKLLKDAEQARNEPRKKRGRVAFTTEEKILKNLWIQDQKRGKGKFNKPKLVELGMALLDGKTEAEVSAFVDSMFAKEAQAAETK